MKIQGLILSACFTAAAVFSGAAMADDCSVDISGNDAMQFDKKAITISKECKEFTVNLKHTGKLGKNVMGHNWVLSKAADAQAITSDGIPAGLDNEYLKPDDERVIAATDIIGGGETTSVTFSVSELDAAEKYEFFCSFPGHISMMRGTVTLK